MNWKMLFSLIAACAFFQSATAQSQNLEDTLQSMLNHEQYTEITDWMEYVNMDTLSGRSLYYVGVAYYVIEEDSMAEKYLKASIKKDPYFGGSYYYLGLLNEYRGNLKNARQMYQSALSHSPGNALYLEHLADVLDMQGLTDSAFVLYKRIIDEEEGAARIYMKVAEIFVQRGAEQKALDTYYDCLYNARSASEHYNDCLFNIGYFEYQFGNYRDAALILETLLDRTPNDYYVVEKLIQVYLKMENFNKVNEYRSQLYEAHKNDEVPEELEERFLLDQFEVDDKLVQAYEYFDKPEEPGDNKYAFVIAGENDTIQRQLILEFSSFAMGSGKKYAMVEVKDGEKMIFKEALFAERVNFKKLKDTVAEIVEGELKPVKQ